MRASALSVSLACVLAWGLACSGAPTPEDPAPAPTEPAQAPAAPAEGRRVAEELRYRKGEAGPDFSAWSPGDRVWLGVDLANLRQQPSSDAPIVATLPMGEPLLILEASSEPATVLERTNRWYKVRAGRSEGHVFGSLLTPVLTRADLDGDGGHEVISVTFSPDFSPRVRVMEPEISEQDDRMVGLDLKMPGLARGGTVRATVLGDATNPWELLKVSLCEEQRCVERLVGYLDGGKPLGQLAEIPGDPSKLKLVPGGFTLGDKLYRPMLSAFSASVEPSRESFVPREPEEVALLEIEQVERGPDSQVICSTIGTLKEEPHKGRSLVSCAILQGGKGDPDERYHVRFAMRSRRDWVYLPNISPDKSWIYDLLQPALRAAGIQVETDPASTVTHLEQPELLETASWGRLHRSYYAAEPWNPGDKVVLFVHPQHGPVYGNRGGSADLYLPQPEGYFTVYSYWLGDWREKLDNGSGQAHRYNVRRDGCGSSYESRSAIAELSERDLRPFENSAGQPLFVLRDPSHPFVEARWSEYRQHHQGTPELAAFVASVPLLLWKDPYGRLIELLRDDLMPPWLCEPVLYFYGTDAPVTVTLDPDIRVTLSDPPVQGHAWTVLPTGDGGLRLPGGERAWPYLFWEGQHGLFDPPEGGEVVARSEVRAHLRRVLPAHGLQGREIDDFIGAWAPRLEQSPYVRISFHARADIDALVPMEISPAPDTLLRVMMEYAPLSRRQPSQPIAPPALPPRRGFVVVEWGGVVRPDPDTQAR